MQNVLPRARSEKVQRNVVRVLITILSLIAASLVMALLPTLQRPIPGQEITVGGSVIFIKAAEHDQAFIPDSLPTASKSYEALCSAIGTLCLSPTGERVATAATWLIAMAVTDLLTNLAKNFCGYLRPNFYAGCWWDETTRSCARPFHDGRHSFPSGRASASCPTEPAAAAALGTWLRERSHSSLVRRLELVSVLRGAIVTLGHPRSRPPPAP